MTHIASYIKSMDKVKDRIRGCLIGGAAGDALGYQVEFMSYDEITGKYGSNGITAYQLHNGKALVSDDTQMTLFTANGLLVGETRGKLRGILADPWIYAGYAYLDWYRTQTMTINEADEYYSSHYRSTWLSNIPGLYSRRAPGMTCLSALEGIKDGNDFPEEFIGKSRVNNSKGCGGIMRTAPVALDAYTHKLHDSDLIAAECAAITHGHSLGFMPSAFLNHLLLDIIYEDAELEKAVTDSLKAIKSLFENDKHIGELSDIIMYSVRLSVNKDDDVGNIQRIGEGWVAEEALAISLYCALRYRESFSQGIIAAVNHSGDSDSTGAIAGNILGALHGYASIEDKWKHDLELKDIILILADDLYTGCQMDGWGKDTPWREKYIQIKTVLPD